MNPPVIIIGAGRSGTNALRDALCGTAVFHTWPCDEINYIWRSGNRGYATDELRAEHAHPQARRKIISAFDRQARQEPTAHLVEKTCANSLRVEFVHQIFPDAKFVHLVRDGRAVVASATKRWTAPLDVPYLVKKARFVPPLDLPYYAYKYFRSRLDRVRSDEDRLSWWGPRFDGMDQFTSETPLVEVAARQWLACVSRSTEQLRRVPAENVHTLTYRDLVTDPGAELARLVDSLGVSVSEAELSSAAASLHGGSVDSWRSVLDAEQQQIVGAIVDDMNLALGVGNS